MRIVHDTLILFAFLFMFGLVIMQGIELNKVQEKMSEINTQYYYTNVKIEEAVNKCERMTDSCIHILSSGAWE